MFTSSERVNSDFTKDSKITKAQEVPHIVLSKDFGGRAENIIYIAEPLVRILKSVDGNLKATFSHVCDAIDRAMLLMKERIRKRCLDDYFKQFLEIFERRWKNQHSAGY